MDTTLKDLLSKKARRLERKRKATYAWSKVYFILIVPLKIIFRAACFILAVICAAFPPILMYLIICGVVYLLLEIFNNPVAVYADRTKKNILPDIYKALNQTVGYQPAAINRGEIEKSTLFKPSYFTDKIHIEGDDYLNGTIEKTEFIVNQIKIYKEVIDYGKTIGGCLFSILLFPIFIIRNIFADHIHEEEMAFFGIIKKKSVLHNGLFIKSSLPEEMKGKALIISKETDDNKVSSTVFTIAETTALDQFIKTNYNIYSSNRNESQALVTTKLIETIKAIHRQENTFPTVTLINQELYLFIPRETDLFKVSIQDKIKDATFFDSFLNDINYINSVIKGLS